ncbi:MAG: hypothetical protein ACUVXJ_19730 [Phycisphaerae bacterium]
MTIRRTLLALLMSTLCSQSSEARVRFLGPRDLLGSAHVVAIVRLSESVEPGQIVEMQVLNTIAGGPTASSIRMVYPQPHFEEMWAHVPPQKGTLLLAFLKKRADGLFVAATAISRGRDLVDGKEVEKESFHPAGGNRCLKLIKDEAEVDRVAALLPQFLQWDNLNADQRAGLLRASLTGPEVMRDVALSWLVIDRKIDFEKRAEVSDELVGGVLANLHSPNRRIRDLACVATDLAARSRKDLVPYIVDALDDPQTRLWAVSGLDGRRGVGPGPILDADLPLDKKADVLKEWWARTGSKKPEFQRFVPKSAAQSPPGTPVRSQAAGGLPSSRPAGASTQIELTTKIRSTQPAAQPTTEPSAAAAK